VLQSVIQSRHCIFDGVVILEVSLNGFSVKEWVNVRVICGNCGRKRELSRYSIMSYNSCPFVRKSPLSLRKLTLSFIKHLNIKIARIAQSE
jgi:uncharacterized CHY-type Zn-finger protein